MAHAPAAPTSEKAQRQAAVVDAGNAKVFTKTPFGRKRVSRPVRLALGLAAVLAFPLVFYHRARRGSDKTH